MKKVFFGILIMLSLSMSATNLFDKTVNKTNNSVETVYTDGKNAATTVYSDLKTIAPKISDGVKEVAKGLKVGAESVWCILVKQQMVWSICFLILTLSAIFNWYLFYKRNLNIKLKESNFVKGEKDIIGKIPNKSYNKYQDNSSPEIDGPVGKEEILILIEGNTNYWFKYIHLTLCLALSYFSFIHFADMLTGFINPEFGAIKTIATIVQNIK